MRNSIVRKNTINLSLFQQKQNLLFGTYFPNEYKPEVELRDIFNQAKKESSFGYNPPYQSVIRLSYYIRRNRNYIEETIKNLYSFLDYEDNLSEKITVNTKSETSTMPILDDKLNDNNIVLQASLVNLSSLIQKILEENKKNQSDFYSTNNII